MAEEIDFSELPTNDSRIIIVAGALAGILEHSVMYPIDSVKTRIQLFKSINPKISISSVLKNMIKKEGLLAPYRGIGAVLIGAGPVHSLYFGSYEFSKKNLPRIHNKFSDSTMLFACSGIIATVMHDFLLNPIEVVKQRLQMDNNRYKGIAHCIKCVSKSEGLKAFYRSYTTQLLMNIPYNSVNFVTYETMRKFLYSKIYSQNDITKHETFNSKIHLIAGSCSGGLAAALTIPLDVIKTQLNTQVVVDESGTTHRCCCKMGGSSAYNISKSITSSKYILDCSNLSLGSSLITASNTRSLASSENVPLSGISDAAAYIYKNGGIRGFFRGTLARVIYNTPACAICWSVYEFFKHSLQT